MNFWEMLSTENSKLAIAAVAGATVSSVFEWKGVLPTIRKIFIGAVTAFYLGPVGVPLFQWAGGLVNIPLEPSASVGGFVIGIGGMTIVELIVKIWRFRLHELPHEVDHDKTVQ